MTMLGNGVFAYGQKARDILKNHKPEPLDLKLAVELSRIIASVEQAT